MKISLAALMLIGSVRSICRFDYKKIQFNPLQEKEFLKMTVSENSVRLEANTQGITLHLPYMPGSSNLSECNFSQINQKDESASTTEFDVTNIGYWSQPFADISKGDGKLPSYVELFVRKNEFFMQDNQIEGSNSGNQFQVPLSNPMTYVNATTTNNLNTSFNFNSGEIKFDQSSTPLYSSQFDQFLDPTRFTYMTITLSWAGDFVDIDISANDTVVLDLQTQVYEQTNQIDQLTKQEAATNVELDDAQAELKTKTAALSTETAALSNMTHELSNMTQDFSDKKSDFSTSLIINFIQLGAFLVSIYFINKKNNVIKNMKGATSVLNDLNNSEKQTLTRSEL